MPPNVAPHANWYHALVVMGTALPACGGRTDGPGDAGSDDRDVSTYPNPDAAPFHPRDAGAVSPPSDAGHVGDVGDGGDAGVDCAEAFARCCGGIEDGWAAYCALCPVGCIR